MGVCNGGRSMYQAGDWVVYGIHGACHVVGTEKQLVNRKRTQYLVLEPMSHTESRFYLPLENPTALAKLKPVLTKDEMIALLASDEVRQDIWVPEDNMRKHYFRELLGSGDRVSVMRIITTLYRYRDAQLAAGRKFHQSDDNFLRDAEKLLISEISLVMEKSIEEAKTYLREQLKTTL